ncbi:MAG: helix-turn-helix domain-containing protein [Peptococcaceae bacterium]|nr:helix-turn-helix domain-containing protein [Peptococcaceae bacterium]
MLKKTRVKKGFSLLKLYQATGIDPANLSRLERGLVPAYPGWRKRIAEALGVPESELFPEVVRKDA